MEVVHTVSVTVEAQNAKTDQLRLILLIRNPATLSPSNGGCHQRFHGASRLSPHTTTSFRLTPKGEM